MSPPPSIILNRVGFTWPDGVVALRHITGSFGRGRTGLVGLNGSGKSTLLRLIAGELTPTTGTITTSAEVTYLPQTLPLDVDATAADLLGVQDKLVALRAITAGDAAERHFETLDDDWDIETRAAEALRDAGLPREALDRRVGELSGGEAVLLAIAGLRLRSAPIALLDEPSNNLDRDARRRLAAMVRSWKGALVVVSHDLALLDLMDHTAELHGGALSIFGGPYHAYREHLEQEQAAAQQAVRAAEQVVWTEQRQRAAAETKLARRQRYGHAAFENKRQPKVVMNQRKTDAQVSAGRLRTEAEDKIRAARTALDEAIGRVRADPRIRLDLPDPDVPTSRRLAEFGDGDRKVVVRGRSGLR